MRVLGRFTDGVATWTEQLDDPEVSVSDPKTVFFKGGALIAKAPGTATLRSRRSGHYTEAFVDVAAHPRGAITDYLTGLPPVTGLAWTPQGLIIGNRDVHLWRAGADGVFRPITKIAASSPEMLGANAIAARADGELAVGLGSTVQKILILHQSDDYRSSHWVEPETDGVPSAFSWHDDRLIVAMDTGAVCRVAPDGVTETIIEVDAHPVALAVQNDSMLVLCLPDPLTDRDSAPTALWSSPLDASEPAVDLLSGQGLTDVGRVLSAGSQILLTEPRGGRLLALRDGQTTTLASDLDLPGELAVSNKGEIFFAKRGAGAVRRIFA